MASIHKQRLDYNLSSNFIQDYQFWTEANCSGEFSIKNVRCGEYNLYAWVPGFLGDYRFHAPVTIIPGCDINVGDLIYEPPRDGPTLWEIGIPDRSAAEFHVPEPHPNYVNQLFVNNPKRFVFIYESAKLTVTWHVNEYAPRSMKILKWLNSCVKMGG